MSEQDGGPDASGPLGTLLAVAAHELSSPLTGILAFARYAAQHTDPQARVHQLVLDIEREALRCAATIQDLLMFSRVSGLEEPAHARLGDLIAGPLAELAVPIQGNGIAVALDVAPDTPPLHVQTRSVQRALVALLSSAIDALCSSRTIQPRIALRGAPDAGGVLLRLDDNAPVPPRPAARSGQALARAVFATQGGTLTVQERPEFSIRIWLPAAPVLWRP